MFDLTGGLREIPDGSLCLAATCLTGCYIHLDLSLSYIVIKLYIKCYIYV